MSLPNSLADYNNCCVKFIKIIKRVHFDVRLEKKLVTVIIGHFLLDAPTRNSFPPSAWELSDFVHFAL